MVFIDDEIIIVQISSLKYEREYAQTIAIKNNTDSNRVDLNKPYFSIVIVAFLMSTYLKILVAHLK